MTEKGAVQYEVEWEDGTRSYKPSESMKKYGVAQNWFDVVDGWIEYGTDEVWRNRNDGSCGLRTARPRNDCVYPAVDMTLQLLGYSKQ